MAVALNRALESARQKGAKACLLGMPRDPPYPDHRKVVSGSVTWSRAFRRAWLSGFDEMRKRQCRRTRKR